MALLNILVRKIQRARSDSELEDVPMPSLTGLAAVSPDMCGCLPWHKDLLTVRARDRALTCVRPRCAAIICRGPVWWYADRVQITQTSSKGFLSGSGFPGSDLVDHLPIRVVVLLTPPLPTGRNRFS